MSLYCRFVSLVESLFPLFQKPERLLIHFKRGKLLSNANANTDTENNIMVQH